MGFLDKIVDVLGFVEREDVEEEEVVAERPVQIAAKSTAMPVKAENRSMTRINNVVSFTNPNREHTEHFG